MAEQLDVLILVQAGCHFCRDAQAMLDRLAGEYPLRIRTLDMTTPEGERIALEAGLLFPPGILVQGRPLCYGRPSEGKLRRAIEQCLAEDPNALGALHHRGGCGGSGSVTSCSGYLLA